MLRKRIASSLAALVLFSLLLTPAVYADVQPPALVDGPSDQLGHTSPPSPRLIIELASPPLAAVYQNRVKDAAVNGRLAANTAAAQAYISQLQAEQAAFVSIMQAAMPSATVGAFVTEAGAYRQATYQVVFNGLAIDPGMDRDVARQQLARLPGVKAVYLDLPHATDLYTSTTLINAPALWNNAAIGKRANGGAGIKFASIDGGVHHSAPMMNGAGYSYPAGFGPNGLGLTANNNGKIIVSRAYFRPWDPPATGDENAWPGVNGTSHGMHTASTAAGGVVTASYDGLNLGTISGVAPQAYVMSYRVFYASVNGNGSFYTTEGIAAVEDMVKDGADVVNNSWGGGPSSSGGPFDALDEALINAVNAGVFVAMSNGNSGPGLGTADHASTPYMNVAASTTGGNLTGKITLPSEPALQTVVFQLAAFGPGMPVGQVLDSPFLPSGVASPANELGCKLWPANTFASKVALIPPDGCNFSQKVFYAQQAGAVAVIIYNNTAGGDTLITMTGGVLGNLVTIPAAFIGNSDGVKFVNYYNTNGPATSILRISTVAFQRGNIRDEIASFSSRGPGVGDTLKPDIAAPGVNIVAQGFTEDAEGEARHLGYGQISGTSMAAPHVAGAAILLRQIHPNWSTAYIKSALMSTAKYLDIYLADGVTPAQPLDMGAGRLDLTHAADPGLILNPPSLSFGKVFTGTEKVLTVQVTNIGNAAETYSLSTLYTGAGFTATTSLPGFSVSPASITVNPNQSTTISVTFNSATSAGLSDNQGFILLHGATHDAHLAAWARVIPALKAADVLIVDDSAAVNSYLSYYTNALDKLGYTYQVIDDLELPVPNAALLSAYKAVLYFTGYNYQPTLGLLTQETDRLVEYLNGGGAVIAMGEDLAATLAADEKDSADAPFFYSVNLGANWIQDSISNEHTPTELIGPSEQAPQALRNLKVDVTKLHDYAATGDLRGTSETPSVNTATRGNFDLFYDSIQNELAFKITVQPTTTTPINVTDAQIHVGAVGVVGPVVRNLALNLTLPVLVTTSLTLQGIVTPSLTSAEVDELLSNQFYINVHTTANPNGEIRGQIRLNALENQPYIDEIDNRAHDGSQDPTGVDVQTSIPLLRYPGASNQYDGTVALANRQQPSLENPGITYVGRTIYTTFGLEGISDDFNVAFGITPTTRSQLLGAFLNWVWSEPGKAVISDTTSLNSGQPLSLTASLTQNTAPAVSYRWDFGDGSAYAGPFTTPIISRAYRLCGVKQVRVEITDANGNVAIGSKTLQVTQNCAVQQLYLPLIKK